MVNPDLTITVQKQCKLLALARSTFYYVIRKKMKDDLEIMRLIDECHLKLPFYGSRRIVDWLGDEGLKVNRKRVRRLMRIMGLEASHPKKRLSTPNAEHKIYPSLLRTLEVVRPNQVWATDVTYIADGKGVCLPLCHHRLAF